MDTHPDEGRIQRILVGVDGSEGAETAVRWTGSAGLATGADVVAAHALSTPVFADGFVFAAGTGYEEWMRAWKSCDRTRNEPWSRTGAGPGRGGDRVPSGDR